MLVFKLVKYQCPRWLLLLALGWLGWLLLIEAYWCHCDLLHYCVLLVQAYKFVLRLFPMYRIFY